MIHLVGPGGAGKSTVGRALAARLGITFVDLDEQFTASGGNISVYLAAHGYQAYAAQNIQICLDTLGSLESETVLALSSGFMTYHDDTHRGYGALRRGIVESTSTVVLLPSFDYETCVAETVRRQLTRPFARSAEREEQVIRSRFGLYWGLPAKKFETAGPVEVVVDNLVGYLPQPSIGWPSRRTGIDAETQHLSELQRTGWRAG